MWEFYFNNKHHNYLSLGLGVLQVDSEPLPESLIQSWQHLTVQLLMVREPWKQRDFHRNIEDFFDEVLVLYT